jgi:hypothetical protein
MANFLNRNGLVTGFRPPTPASLREFRVNVCLGGGAVVATLVAIFQTFKYFSLLVIKTILLERRETFNDTLSDCEDLSKMIAPLFIIELRKTTFSPILSLFRFLSHYEKRLF